MMETSDAFSVVLFNMTSSDKGMLQPTRDDNMELMLDRILDEMPTPLFILCQEKLNSVRKQFVINKLRRSSFMAMFCHTVEAGIIYVWKIFADLNVRLIHELIFLKDREQENDDLKRLKAFVIAAGQRKILLISWHGYKQSYESNKEVFSRLVRLSEGLRVETSCNVVILGGDFNLPAADARDEMTRLNEYNGTVCDDYQTPPDRGQKIDYIVYWPNDQLAPPCTRPDFRNILEKGSRPFDHPVVGFRFEDPVYVGLNRQGPPTRRIAEIITEIAQARRPSALPLRLCYHVQRDTVTLPDDRVADKAVCRRLPDLTPRHVNMEEKETTLFLAIGKEQRQKQYVDQMRAISIYGLSIGGEHIRVEFYYSSVWNPVSMLKNVDPTCLFCIWCRCCTRILDFDTSLSGRRGPVPTLPWIGYAPGQSPEWLLRSVDTILSGMWDLLQEEEDIDKLSEEFDHLMDQLTMRTQDVVTYEEFQDLAFHWAEALLQKGERFQRHVINIKRIAECVQNHLPCAYGVVLKHKSSQSQATNAERSGTDREASGGSRSGEPEEPLRDPTTTKSLPRRGQK